MNIQNISEMNLSSYSSQSLTKKSSNIMTEAIQGYADECLTGLTEEERKAIEKQIRAYLDKIPEGQKVDREALTAFVAKLLKEYGFKGDLDDMAQFLIGEVGSVLAKASSTATDAKVAYEKLTSDHTIDSLEESSDKPKDLDGNEETISQIVTNPDGSKSLVVMKQDVVLLQIKIGIENLFNVDSKELHPFMISSKAILEA